jgi:hypothetical protein
MHNVIHAAHRRKAGLAATVVLVGGVAGGMLLTGGVANAASPVPTSTAVNLGSTAAAASSGGSWYINVPVTVTDSAGAPAPDGTVKVYNTGTYGCTVNLTATGAATSGGSCNLPVTGNGGITVEAEYSGSTVNNLKDSYGQAGTTVSGVVTDVAPTFTADSPATSARTGSNYYYQFAASGTPTPTFSLSGPSWLSINSTTGQVSGTVQGWPGSSFTYSVTASNGVNPSVTDTFKVWITGNGNPGGNGKLYTRLNCTSPVHSGSQGTCTLSVTNYGGNSARNVVAEIDLPSQLRADFCGHGWGWGWFNSWGCSISWNTASQDLGTLWPGQTRSLTVTFTAQSTRYLWGWGHQYRQWVRVVGSAQSSGGWNWFGGNASYSAASVLILPPHWFWW